MRSHVGYESLLPLPLAAPPPDPHRQPGGGWAAPITQIKRGTDWKLTKYRGVNQTINKAGQKLVLHPRHMLGEGMIKIFGDGLSCWVLCGLLRWCIGAAFVVDELRRTCEVLVSLPACDRALYAPHF